MKVKDSTNEYEIIKICLQANLQVLEMCQTGGHEKKDVLLLTVVSELQNMCETVIPIFESRIGNIKN